MQLTFYNENLIENHEVIIPKLRDFVFFCMEKFFRKNRLEKMQIDVEFIKNYEADTRMTASCIWEDTHYRPNEYTIQIDSDLSFVSMINALAHEVTHVKQWGKGEFYELVSKSKKDNKFYKFCNKIYAFEKVSYKDRPWEIEAHGNSIMLPLEYCHEKNLSLFEYLPFELLPLEDQKKYGFIS